MDSEIVKDCGSESNPDSLTLINNQNIIIKTESDNGYEFDKVFIREFRNEDIEQQGVGKLNNNLDNESFPTLKQRKIIKVVKLPKRNCSPRTYGNRKKNIILNLTSPIINKHCASQSNSEVNIKQIGEITSTNKKFTIVHKIVDPKRLSVKLSKKPTLSKNTEPSPETVFAGPTRLDCELLSNIVDFSPPITYKLSEPGDSLRKSKDVQVQLDDLSNINSDDDVQIIETKPEINGLVQVKTERHYDQQEGIINLDNDEHTIERKPEIIDLVEIKSERLTNMSEEAGQSCFSACRREIDKLNQRDDQRLIEPKQEINELVDRDIHEHEGFLLSEQTIKKEEPEETEQYDLTGDIPMVLIKNEIHENDDTKEESCTQFTNGTEVNCTQNTDTQTWTTSRRILPAETRQITDLSLLSTCTLCDVVIQDTVKDHIENYHRNGIFFSCPFCDYNGRFSIRVRKSSVCTHTEKHKQKGIVICQFCDQNFPTWLTANVHIAEEHENEVDKRCNLCRREFESYSKLLLHILHFHNGESLVLKCDNCNFVTLNPSLMQVHKEAQHKPNIPVHKTEKKQEPTKKKPKSKIKRKCPICGKLLDTMTMYRSHLRTQHV